MIWDSLGFSIIHIGFDGILSGFYRILWDFLGFFGISLKFLGFFGIPHNPYWILWDSERFFDIFQDALGFFQDFYWILWHFSGFFGISLKLLGFFKILRHFSGFFGILSRFFKILWHFWDSLRFFEDFSGFTAIRKDFLWNYLRFFDIFGILLDSFTTSGFIAKLFRGFNSFLFNLWTNEWILEVAALPILCESLTLWWNIQRAKWKAKSKSTICKNPLTIGICLANLQVTRQLLC